MQQQLTQDRNTINQLIQRVNELNERVDGLTTVIEGLNSSIAQLQSTQRDQPVQQESNSLFEARISKLEGECVKKADIGHYTNSTQSSGNSTSESGQKSDALLEKKSRSALYSEGVRLFQKHHYDEAKERFTHTASRNYKPAASNYYLGEIAYYTKHYKDAVFYFKKSAGLYDQASYMDTLLLHTAISLEKSGDKSQAKIFYQTIIDGYPGKKSAAIARKKINKL
jgi:TolA-binding protein